MKLYRHANGRFTLLYLDQYFTGNVKEIIARMEFIGVEWNEIEEGFVHLILNQHTVAEYGINKTFMYTAKEAA